MTAIINRLKDSLQSEASLPRTVEIRFEKLAKELNAPSKIKSPIFH